jgi:hypothetical protein
MVNSQVVAEIVEALKLDSRVDTIPNPIPTIEVGIKNIKNSIFKSISTNTTGNNTVYTVPLNQRFYLTNVTLDCIKDAASDATNISFRASSGGVILDMLILPGITLTAANKNISIQFKNPILIDSGTNIIVNFTKSVGVIMVTCSIIGILDEVS